MNNIHDIAAMLAKHGYRGARERLVLDCGHAHQNRQTTSRGYPDFAYLGMADAASSAQAAAGSIAENAEDAAHALCVLHGTYDAQVMAGEPTMLYHGTMPTLTAEAHAMRRAQIAGA